MKNEISALDKKIDYFVNQRKFRSTSQFKNHFSFQKKNIKIWYGQRFFIYPSHKVQIKFSNKRRIHNEIRIIDHFCLSNFKRRSHPTQVYLITKETSLDFSMIKSSDSQLEQIKQQTNEFNHKMNYLEKKISDNNDSIETYNIQKRKILHKLKFSEVHRKSLNDYIHSIKGNIRVYCRVKPSNGKENSMISYPEHSSNKALNEQTDINSLELKSANNKENLFYFDKVFTQKSTQQNIFTEVKPFIESALDGENVCIFAYGSTGSGKTFTMQGRYDSSSSSGILPRCADFIFAETARRNILGDDYKLFFSAIEIYNENIFDLLSEKSAKGLKIKTPLSIFVHGNDIQIKNLTWVELSKREDILYSTKIASETRRSDSTKFNSTSSRSHAVFQIKIECTREASTYSSTINIIDLAGSERSSLTSFAGKTKEEIEAAKKIQNEANFINKSLTTLGRIISLIGDKKVGKVAIPYRESKLTMVLQVINQLTKNSLKPSSKTVMIVTICSESQSFNLTKESLKFASNAMISC